MESGFNLNMCYWQFEKMKVVKLIWQSSYSNSVSLKLDVDENKFELEVPVMSDIETHFYLIYCWINLKLF